MIVGRLHALLVLLTLTTCVAVTKADEGSAGETSPRAAFATDVFLYGASVYPELLSKQEQVKMLDLFHDAGLNVLRLSDSSWGNLEPGPGVFNFQYMQDFLDEAHRRGMKAILGTGSYIAPQWLTAKHEDVLWVNDLGNPINPMSRHAACRNHPRFRAELERFLLAYAGRFKDHPAVIGWQLDNEIEWNLGFRIDYNPHNKEVWHAWLRKTYHTEDELNRRLGLTAWGLLVSDLDDVPLPSKSNDGDLSALFLANLHFQRDDIQEYFRWQKAAIRRAGAKQWITTDYLMFPQTLADDPVERNPIEISGVNQYPPLYDDPKRWAQQAAYQDIHRSIHGHGKFLVTESSIGATGSERLWTAPPSRKQFFLWMVHPAAFGAHALLHWSGNRFTAGHWPHWGGMLDWSGNPEPDFEWVKQVAAFYRQWGPTLVHTGVESKAAVLTDFDQRAALMIYPHTAGDSSADLLAEIFDAFHRNGIGVDAVTAATAKDFDALKKYRTLVIPASPCLDGAAISPALRRFAEQGGTVVIAPLTGYQTWDGVFRSDGFAADLGDLFGGSIPTLRMLGYHGEQHVGKSRVAWTDGWGLESSPIGLDGFCEILQPRPDTQVIARFVTDEEVLNGKPAVTLNKLGQGRVVKLSFWPAKAGFLAFLSKLCEDSRGSLRSTLPAGAMAVPRTDGTLFLMNTLSSPVKAELNTAMRDRITGAAVATSMDLQPYDILWLEAAKSDDAQSQKP